MKDCDAMVSPRCWCHGGGVTMFCTEHLPFLYYGLGLLPGSSLSEMESYQQPLVL